MFLEVQQNLFNVLDFLINLVPLVDKGMELDVVEFKVQVKVCAIDPCHFVINYCDASTKRLVDGGEGLIRCVQDLLANLDCCRQCCTHHTLDRREIVGSDGAAITLAIDVGWVDCVRVALLHSVRKELVCSIYT